MTRYQVSNGKRRLQQILPLLLCGLVIGGCQTQSVRRPPSSPVPGAGTTTVDQATRMSGDDFMQQAATAAGKRAADLYLRAGDAYTLAADWSGLRAALASVTNVNDDAGLFLRYTTLQAGLALHDGDASQAGEWLANRQPALDSIGGRDPVAEQTNVLQAAVCAALEQFVCAANALISVQQPQTFASAPWFTARSVQQPLTNDLPSSSRAPFADPQKAAAASLNNQLWHYLTQAPASQVQLQAASARSRAAKGWWQLHSAVAQGASLPDQQQALTDWQRRYSSHSAGFPWPDALAAILQAPPRIESIAVVLPLSGPLSAAGNAVRNGIISAQLRDPEPLSVRFYDVAAEPLPALYERAIAAGAQALIGPLSKANVDTLSSLSPGVPALALNYLAEGSNPPHNLLQLGLAIEDEADTLVRELAAQNHQRVLIVHSEQSWSRRAAQRLAATLKGTATVESFANAKTVTEAVGRGMLVEESQRRSQGVYRQIGTHIEFTPRARSDLDAVIALVNNTEAKVLVPALKFHFGSHLPVYVTGQATRGAQAKDLANLSGFQVTEIPWFVNGSPLAQEVNAAFALTGNNLATLYALGSDAYQVSDRLGLVADHTDLVFGGSSGALHVRPDGSFHRELSMGVISGSKVIPMPRVASQASR
ncbi:MAG: penicillin-binding protein activator [Pseudomonadales bacterium]